MKLMIPGFRNTIFEKYIKPFKEYLERSGSTERTIETYSLNIRKFFTYLTKEKSSIEKIDQITKKDIIDFQTYLYYFENDQGDKYNIATQSYLLAAVKIFFKFLIRDDYLLFNPASDIELPKQPKSIPRNILTEKEMIKILEVPDMETETGIRDRAIIELLYSTGIRVSELCNLTIYDVCDEEEMLRINQGKGKKDRVIAIGKTALKYIKFYIELSRPKLIKGFDKENTLFITDLGQKFKQKSINKLIKRLVKQTNIKKKVTCHTFRHTCASHLLRNNANIRYIQQQLGHRTLMSTQKYLRVEIGDLKEVHRKCHPREQ